MSLFWMFVTSCCFVCVVLFYFLFLYGLFCHGALRPNCLHCLQHVFSEHRFNLYYPIFVFTIQIAPTQHVFQLTAKCLTCFECANTTQPADCTTTKQCGMHEVCLAFNVSADLLEWRPMPDKTRELTLHHNVQRHFGSIKRMNLLRITGYAHLQCLT